MKKGVLGIILSILGILSLISITIDFMSGGTTARNVISLFGCALLGAGLFFAGLMVHYRASGVTESQAAEARR